MKVCTKCHKLKLSSEFNKRSYGSKDGLQSHCKACSNEVKRQWRKEYPEQKREENRLWKIKYPEYHRKWNENHREYYRELSRRYKTKYPDRIKAVTTLNHAITAGYLIRPDSCSECGRKSKIHGHHEDYSKPLEVIWLCAWCHFARHRNLVPHTAC